MKAGEILKNRKPIQIDPATGKKIFDTRADKASERVAGRGYDVVTDKNYLALPEYRTDVAWDDAAKAQMNEFKESRRGADDYVAMEGDFAHYLEDHYSAPPIERESLDDESEIMVVGAGFAGLLLWYRLRDAGFTDVRFCEKGGDVGGTWYWNRYPGIACDVESYSYLPLLDEMGYFPKFKFASGFEIFEYCQSMAERFGFYDLCLFHTEVTGARWDEEAQRWTVETNRGDRMKSKILLLANGVLTTPRLARIEGMDKLQGDSFHTARWDYDVNLTGKRVGIIGTGATAVQVIPEIAKEVGELHIFQRTPSTIDVRDQRKTTPKEIEQWKNEPGWAKRRRERFAKLFGRRALQANDAYLSGKAEQPKRRTRSEGPEVSPEEQIERDLETSYRIMEQIRDRVDAIIDDPEVAESLKAYYPYGCKRPTFHDEFLPTINMPHVHLVDVAPMGVQEINEKGVVHDGVQYEFDVLIYATGFDFMSRETFARITGMNGQTIAEKWAETGVRTFTGLHTNGFPNLLIVAGPQGQGASFNFLDAIEEHSEYVVSLLTKIRELDVSVVDVREEDENEFSDHCAAVDAASAPLRDCLGNFTGYGRTKPGSLAYYGGKGALKRRARALETLEPYLLR